MDLTWEEYNYILRRDLMSFMERSFYELNPQTKFLNSPHIEVLVSKLESCRQGKIRRLIVNLPPRSLKSHAASVVFPAWLLGHDPTMQIICASYGQELADKHARDCRTLMAAVFYRRLFPNTHLSLEKQSVNEFMTTAQGFRMSTSVGGVLTGRGADLIILDDPLKPEEALSEPRRNAVNQWYDHTLVTRLNNKETGVIIIVMQRLHQDDLVGHVMAQENWEVLSFPAISEPLGFDDRATNRHRILLVYYEPSDLPPRFTFVLQSWDTANKSGELNDFSVCTTWGAIREGKYLLSAFRRRLNYPDLKRAVLEQARQHHANIVLIEDKASGTQLIQDLRFEGLYGVRAYEAPTGTDKILRLYAQTAEFESGRVLLPRSASWLEAYKSELTTFPGSKYDDQVDSTTQALDYLKTYRSLLVWAKLGAD